MEAFNKNEINFQKLLKNKQQFQGKIEHLQKENQDLKAFIEEERKNFNLQLHNHTGQHQQFESKVTGLEKQNQELNYMLQQERNNFASRSQQLQELHENNQRNFNVEKKNFKDNEAQKERLQVLTAESNNAKTSLNELNNLTNNQKQTIESLERRLEELTATLNRGSQQYSQVEVERNTYYNRVQELQVQLEAAGNQLNSAIEDKQQTLSMK